jgi:hypothetical protein
MKKLILALPLLLIFACKKIDNSSNSNNNNNNNNNTTVVKDTGCFLTQFSEVTASGQDDHIDSYTWQNGQLIQLVRKYKDAVYKDVYRYNSSNQLERVEYYENDSLIQVQKYSYGVNEIKVDLIQDIDSSHLTFTLTNGHVAEYKNVSFYQNVISVFDQKCTWKDGDLIKEDIYNNDSFVASEIYEYDNKQNPELKKPDAFQRSRNNVIRQYVVDSKGNKSSEALYTYTYNTNGYPVTVSETSSFESYTASYTYDCK